MVEIAATSRHVRDLWTRVRSWVRQSSTATIDRVDELGVSELKVKLRAGIDAGRWRIQGDALFASLAAGEKPVVLAIDELPILVNRLLKGHDYEMTPERRRDTDEFLSWLRKNAQAHRGHIRLVVSGSVGLEPILEQAELSAHANIFAPFELKPWDEETSVACLGELAEILRSSDSRACPPRDVPASAVWHSAPRAAVLRQAPRASAPTPRVRSFPG